jgi:hypothetical protein
LQNERPPNIAHNIIAIQNRGIIGKKRICIGPIIIFLELDLVHEEPFPPFDTSQDIGAY